MAIDEEKLLSKSKFFIGNRYRVLPYMKKRIERAGSKQILRITRAWQMTHTGSGKVSTWVTVEYDNDPDDTDSFPVAFLEELLCL